MPVLDLQRRFHQTGRIRLGYQVSTGKTGKGGKPILKPVKSDTLRFTSPSLPAVRAVAEKCGGEVRPWENRGRNEYEVITKVTEIMVTIAPRDAVVSQWYEMYSGGGCLRRCDSQIEQKSGKPCMCPHAEDPTNAEEVAAAAKRRAELAKLNPPQACKLTTRISVIIPDLPDIGVWRLDTHGFYAAGELLDKTAFMELCRDHGLYIPARLWIDHRVEVVDGQTRKYPVPVLELLVTPREVLSGELQGKGWAAQLPPVPGEPTRAITAGTAQPAAPEPAKPATAPMPPATAPMTAQQFADVAPLAATQEEVNVLVAQAKEARVLEDQVCTRTDDGQETWEELVEVLRDRYRKVPAAATAEAGESK